ncbi:1-aminocyclopropane-1-carboxylate deaminase/D-cysteine desulfhydrase [Thalassotalea sp. ND16A]|uniref:1-aminocyclopropane-1-carboxylate deaminase/D-cysteine desulfhydrase n=1 Tax=Thalassotalea sp. ND16A TaxID=1535422 RepID=UPI001F1E3292|nr:pyridoxal-phosphate dependent enzyme [Thalassotalea sp. ND16A]
MSSLNKINYPAFSKHQVEVFIKRDDLIHPIISGNKWRKLKYNLKAAKEMGKTQILSFGGAYSNHIHALAYAGKINNLDAIGIIRGEPHYRNNFTLTWATHWGMTLEFVDRKTYKLRHNEEYLAQLQLQYPDAYIIPEGGSNHLALPGVGEVITELNEQLEYDYLLTPVGSGGTLAGLINADNNQHNLLGIAVLKQDGYLADEVNLLLAAQASNLDNWKILNQFHRGGYGKYKTADAQRILQFSQQTGIPFEPVYSGKMLLAFLDLLEQGYFQAGAKIVLLHTGGLQGLGGMAERGLLNADEWPVPERAPNC